MTKLYWTLPLLMVSACIGDDLVYDEVEPEVRIMNPIDTIEINTTYQFEAVYLNNVGVEGDLSSYLWASSAQEIISIEQNGLATALKAGTALISVSGLDPGGKQLRDEKLVVVGNSTVVSSNMRTGSLRTTSSYLLKGDFSLEKISGGVKLSFNANYEASTALPGLYVYLTNNLNTIDNALEIGAVKVFKGAHSYDLNGVDLNQYSHVLYFCKPFRVKVGDGPFAN
ncbi:MAG: hypothetical protein IPL46_04215 [Saprospiraceae bacterium]|nr:hypothetical protein [Saprospiraceae bacterium]